MSRFIHKTHNVSVLLYHFVCPTKYRLSGMLENRGAFSIDAKVDSASVEICEGIRYFAEQKPVPRGMRLSSLRLVLIEIMCIF